FLKEIYIAYWDSVNVVWDLELVDIPFMLDPSELFVTSDGKNRFLMYDDVGIHEITGGDGVWTEELIYEGDVGDPHLALDKNDDSHVIFHSDGVNYGVKSNGTWLTVPIQNYSSYIAIGWDVVENAAIVYSGCLQRSTISAIDNITYESAVCDLSNVGSTSDSFLKIDGDGNKNYLIHGIFYKSALD
ncbi:hypothetical protein K8I61_19440, partial [bacterium]|nr:hypothetical protein [bacterium]